MFSLMKSVMSRMLPFVTASPMCCESRTAMSKSVWRAANWVNIASWQFAVGTVLTLTVTLGRSLEYSSFAKSSSSWAGGHSNQMKLSSRGSSVSSGIVAGATGPLASAFASSPPSPPPQAARVSAATSVVAATDPALRPWRELRRSRCALLIDSPASLHRGMWWLVPCGAASPGRRDVLGLHELEQALGAPLAPQTALLGAAEGCGRVRDEPAVEADHAALDALREAQTAAEVARVEIAHEAVLGVVDEREHLLLPFEADHRRDRSEDLLVQDPGVRWHVDQHGRGVEAPRPVGGTLAAQQCARATGHGVPDEFVDLSDGLVVDERAALAALVLARADPDGGHAGDEPGDEGVVDRPLDEEPVGGGAGLTAVTHLRDHRALDRRVDVGVVEDDEGGVAAELHAGLEHLLGGGPQETAAGLRRAGEGEHARAGVGEHRLDDGTGPSRGDDRSEERRVGNEYGMQLLTSDVI